MDKYEFPTNLQELSLEKVRRTDIGKELTDLEWIALAYRIESAVEFAVIDTIEESFDNLSEVIAEYQQARYEREMEEEVF